VAGTSLLTLLDDIATLLDDVSLLTKEAASKTVGVLGDDLALNAEQVTGVRAARELPVVWAVAKGSALNKLIIVPVALGLSFVAPWLITVLLMLGGGYLCFEGFEKVAHKFLHPAPPDAHKKKLKAVSDPKIDLVAFEKEKIKGAIRTDFVLSAEIVVIALGTVQNAPFASRVGVVVAIAVGITVFVYALVAGIVKMDDLGMMWVKSVPDGEAPTMKSRTGSALLWFAPRFLKALTFVGTIAMFLVGGGILVHGVPFLHHLVHGAEELAQGIPSIGFLMGPVVPTALNGLAGLIAGCLLVLGATAIQRLRAPSAAH